MAKLHTSAGWASSLGVPVMDSRQRLVERQAQAVAEQGLMPRRMAGGQGDGWRVERLSDVEILEPGTADGDGFAAHGTSLW